MKYQSVMFSKPSSPYKEDFVFECYNNKIYVIGGFVNNAGVNSVEIYDIATGTWSNGTNMPTSRGDIGYYRVDDKIYCMGGMGNSQDWNSVLNVHEMYNITTNTWTTLTKVPASVRSCSSVYSNGKIYYPGGSYLGGGYYFVSDIYIYDIANDIWSTGCYDFNKDGTIKYDGKGNPVFYNPNGAMPQRRSFFEPYIYKNKIYCIGGEWGGQNGGYPCDNVDIFDMSTRSWSKGASMPVARSDYVSLLREGKIYFFLGEYKSGSYIYDIEQVDVYDLEHNSWETIGKVPYGADWCNSAFMYNDKAYIWSTGYRLLNDMQNLMIFDFKTQTWSFGYNARRSADDSFHTSKSAFVVGDKAYTRGFECFDLSPQYETPTPIPFSTGKVGIGSVKYGNLIYCIGGYNEDYSLSSTACEVYNIIDGSWTKKADFPVRARGVSAVISGTKIYCMCFDGFDGSSGTSGCMYIYDIPTDTWTKSSATYSYTRSYGNAHLYQGKIYYIGGQASGTVFSCLNIYDIATDTWTTGATPPRKSNFSSQLYNGKIYCFGGHPSTSSSNSTLATYGTSGLSIYDIATNTWTTSTASLPVSLYDNQSVQFNGNIYCLGGSRDTGLTVNTIYIYNIATNKWTTSTNTLPTLLSNFTCQIYNRVVYLIGGMDGFSYNLNKVTKFTLSDIVNTPPTTPPWIKHDATTPKTLDDKVEITWGASTDAEGNALTYDLYFFNGHNWVAIKGNLDVCSFEHTIPINAYNTWSAKYRVRAFDGEYYSDFATSSEFELYDCMPENTEPVIKAYVVL